jgi:hypothetical protein
MRSQIANIRNEPSDKRNSVSIDDTYLKNNQVLTPQDFFGDEVYVAL